MALFGGRQQPCKAPQPAMIRRPPAALAHHVVLHRDFYTHVSNILDYAETRLLEGEAVDFDQVAERIASKVRENLLVVYGPGEAR